jgi:pimeloyl-ACP methyl ester carboxylesterase
VRLLAPAFFFLALALALAPARSLAADAAAVTHALPAPPALPTADREGWVEHDGARLWFGVYGEGRPVILLHPGAGSSDLWGWQVPALVADHHQVILIDSRGHGRSSWDGRLNYDLIERDVVAVMDALGLGESDVVGWSDGAIVALVMAMKSPARVGKIYAYGANMDLGALNPFGLFSPIRREIGRLLAAEYARVSPSPSGFPALAKAVRGMQLREPSYAAIDLASIHASAVAIADGAREEFIRPAHTRYLARTIPGATLIILPGAGHFAPLQAPEAFNASVLGFLDR